LLKSLSEKSSISYYVKTEVHNAKQVVFPLGEKKDNFLFNLMGKHIVGNTELGKFLDPKAYVG